MSRRKCVYKCEGGGPLYKFPSEKEMPRRLEWMRRMGIDVNTETNMYACHRHFSARYRNARNLSYGAVPDINLKPKTIQTSTSVVHTPTVDNSNWDLKNQASLLVQPHSGASASSHHLLRPEPGEVPTRLPTIKHQNFDESHSKVNYTEPKEINLNRNIFKYFANNIVRQLKEFSEEIRYEIIVEIQTLLSKRKVKMTTKTLLTQDQLLCVDKQKCYHDSEKATGNELSTSQLLENIANIIVKALEAFSDKIAYQVMADIQTLLTKRELELIKNTRSVNNQLLCADKQESRHETGKTTGNEPSQSHSSIKESMDLEDNIRRFKINNLTP